MDKLTRKKLNDFSNSLAILKKYPLKKLPDGKVWMVENLREPIKGAVWNEKFNCYMYNWEQAQKVVPPGFHLPNKDEFLELCKALGYGQLKDKEVVQRLIHECGFVYSGWAHGTGGSLGGQGTSGVGLWWSSTWANATNAYRLTFDSSSVYPSSTYNKNPGLAVRCIKN